MHSLLISSALIVVTVYACLAIKTNPVTQTPQDRLNEFLSLKSRTFYQVISYVNGASFKLVSGRIVVKPDIVYENHDLDSLTEVSVNSLVEVDVDKNVPGITFKTMQETKIYLPSGIHWVIKVIDTEDKEMTAYVEGCVLPDAKYNIAFEHSTFIILPSFRQVVWNRPNGQILKIFEKNDNLIYPGIPTVRAVAGLFIVGNILPDQIRRECGRRI